MRIIGLFLNLKLIKIIYLFILLNKLFFLKLKKNFFNFTLFPTQRNFFLLKNLILEYIEDLYKKNLNSKIFKIYQKLIHSKSLSKS
jgi:hypothetical protein